MRHSVSAGQAPAVPEPPGDILDGFARLAARLFDTPMAFVTLAEADGQTVKGRHAWPADGDAAAAALAERVLRLGIPQSSGDAPGEPGFATAGFVGCPPHLRFFAATPIAAAGDGMRGTLCVADPTARTPPSKKRIATLADVAALIAQHLAATRQNPPQDQLALQNVSERLEIEAALRESEGRFRQIADSVPGIIWMTDEAGRITFLSKAFEEYTGKPAEPYYGKTSTQSSHPDDDVSATPQYEAAAEARGRLTYEYRVRRNDGQFRWHLDTCVPRFDDSGRFLGYIGMLTDVEDMRSLSEQLHQAQKMQAVGQLTGGVAHDFNNLLTIILGNAELLAERLTEPPLRRLADATRDAAERSASLVQRLLAFSRRQTLQPKVVDISGLINGMRDLLVRTLGEDVDISFSFAPESWRVLVDRAQLEAAILNLAVNARDAMPEGGRLTIETANVEIEEPTPQLEIAAGPYVRVAVSDTGCGMSKKVLRHAFEPFFTTKDVGKGSGLGLSMVYGFIKQSGGTVTLYSEDAQGSTIKIYLPRADAEAAALDQPARAGSVDRGHETILLVEDDHRVRAHVGDQLREMGYRVVEAANGPDALAALERTPDVALLFTDVVMPGGMNGRQLAEEIHRRRPKLKVLFTTGYTENAIVHHGHLDSDVELLGKPFSRIALARKVRAVLDRAL